MDAKAEALPSEQRKSIGTYMLNSHNRISGLGVCFLLLWLVFVPFKAVGMPYGLKSNNPPTVEVGHPDECLVLRYSTESQSRENGYDSLQDKVDSFGGALPFFACSGCLALAFLFGFLAVGGLINGDWRGILRFLLFSLLILLCFWCAFRVIAGGWNLREGQEQGMRTRDFTSR